MSALFIVLLFLAGLTGLIALMARLEPVLEPAPVNATSAPGRLQRGDDTAAHARSA